MPRTSTKDLYGKALGRDIDELLTEWKDEGLSGEDIAFRLKADHDLSVSTSTVYRWLAALVAPTEATA